GRGGRGAGATGTRGGRPGAARGARAAPVKRAARGRRAVPWAAVQAGRARPPAGGAQGRRGGRERRPPDAAARFAVSPGYLRLAPSFSRRKRCGEALATAEATQEAPC